MARRKKKNNNQLLAIVLLLIVALFYLSESYGSKTEDPEDNKIEQKEIIENNVSSDLKIYFFDVGQADSILIMNNDHNMLIDAGNNEDGPKLVKYLKEELKIKNIEYIVGTHPHEDHIGGLDNIITNFNVDKIYLPDVYTTTKTFEDLLTSIENKNLGFDVPKIGEKFNLGEAEFEVLYTGTDSSDLNNTSIVLKMKFGTKTYLFTGDATSKVEKIILKNNIDIDVLKVGHHGSEYSSCNEFLNKTTPSIAIISVGDNNKYKHPSTKTIDRIKTFTNEIYMTKDNGTIIITSDGNNININTIKTDTNG